MNTIDCPKCGKHILDINTDGTKRLRSKLVLFKDGGTIAVCPICKSEVSVPITITSKDTKYNVRHIILI